MTVYAGYYGKTLCTFSAADALHSAIKDTLSRREDVVVDFSGVESVEFNCSRQIFRRLYIELGADPFYERVFFKNISERDYWTIRKSLISL